MFVIEQCNCYHQTLDAAVHICLWVLSVAVNSWCRVQLSAAAVSSKPVSPVTTCQRLHLALRLHCNRISAAPRLSCSQRAWYEHIKSRPLSITRGNRKLGSHPELGLQMRSCLYKDAQGFQWVARLLLGIFTFINIELMPANPPIRMYPPYLHPECYVPGVQRDSAGPWLVYLGIAGNPARPSPL